MIICLLIAELSYCLAEIILDIFDILDAALWGSIVFIYLLTVLILLSTCSAFDIMTRSSGHYLDLSGVMLMLLSGVLL